MSAIGERLREERERFGLNQTFFAQFGGVQRRAQVNYEQGERAPDATYLAAVAAIGVDVLYILTGMRNENTAFNMTELAYLRNCRALPTPEAKDAGLKMLVSLREAYGITWHGDIPPEGQAAIKATSAAFAQQAGVKKKAA